MSEPMQIEQKKLSNHHTFTFHGDYLNFAFSDKNGSGDLDVAYGDFSGKSSKRIDQHLGVRYLGWLCCGLGVVQSVTSLVKEEVAVSSWLLLGLGCIVWSYLSRMTYTVLPTERGNVFVIQGTNNHDQIIEEIKSRRRVQLRSWYGEINPENDMEKEIAKFRWLADQQALTPEEVEERIAEIRATFGVDDKSPQERIN